MALDLQLCPLCSGEITLGPPLHINLQHPRPHVRISTAVCMECGARLSRCDDIHPWRATTNDLDRLDVPITFSDRNRLAAKNGTSWVEFIELKERDDSLWILDSSSAIRLTVGIVRDDVILHERQFKR